MSHLCRSWGTAILEPAIRILHRGNFGALQRGNLKSAIVKGQWPQARLHAAGLADTSECQLCGAIGTLWHRLYDCPALEFFRLQYGHDELLHCVRWTQCFLGDPSWEYPPPPLTGQVVWNKAPLDDVLDGECYGDGSGRRP